MRSQDEQSKVLALMAEAYREIAEENAREAEEWFSAASELVLSSDSECD